MALLAHDHTQSVASNTWTISHGLNKQSVLIDVMIDDGGTITKILPQSVEHTDNNTITVRFSSAYTGFARIVA